MRSYIVVVMAVALLAGVTYLSSKGPKGRYTQGQKLYRQMRQLVVQAKDGKIAQDEAIKKLKRIYMNNTKLFMDSINRPDSSGLTLLHYAIASNLPDRSSGRSHINLMKFLLSIPTIDIHMATRENETLLEIAVVKSDLPAALLLLEYGADPNTELGTGDTLLQIAALNNQIKIVDMLLEHGAVMDWGMAAEESARRDLATPLDSYILDRIGFQDEFAQSAKARLADQQRARDFVERLVGTVPD